MSLHAGFDNNTITGLTASSTSSGSGEGKDRALMNNPAHQPLGMGPETLRLEKCENVSATVVQQLL